MKHVGHFIAGEFLPAYDGSQIFNPSNGKPAAIAAIGTPADVDRAVAAARAAFPAWSAQGGLPQGVLNVVLGGKAIVDRLVDHPDVAGISFVGSTPVAKAIRIAGVSRNKRVQAFGGGKNHMVVLPDADLDLAADAAASAAYGAAGQRCMAVSVVVAVGTIGDALVHKIKDRLAKLRTGDPAEADTEVGPLITPKVAIGSRPISPTLHLKARQLWPMVAAS